MSWPLNNFKILCEAMKGLKESFRLMYSNTHLTSRETLPLIGTFVSSCIRIRFIFIRLKIQQIKIELNGLTIILLTSNNPNYCLMSSQLVDGWAQCLYPSLPHWYNCDEYKCCLFLEFLSSYYETPKQSLHFPLWNKRKIF